MPKKKITQAKTELKSFLEIFIFNGRSRTVSIKNNISAVPINKRRLVDNKKILSELIGAGVVEVIDNDFSHGDKVQLVKLYEKEVLSFCQDGLRSNKMLELLHKLTAYF